MLKALFSIIFIIFIAVYSLVPNIMREMSSGWVMDQFLYTTLSQIVFFVGIYFFLEKSINSQNPLRKYGVGSLVVGFLVYYAYGSTFYDPAFPTLSALFIYSIAITLVLFLLHAILTLFFKK